MEVILNKTELTHEAVYTLGKMFENKNKNSFGTHPEWYFAAGYDLQGYPTELDHKKYNKAKEAGRPFFINGEVIDGFLLVDVPSAYSNSKTEYLLDYKNDKLWIYNPDNCNEELIALLKAKGSKFVFGHEHAKVEEVPVKHKREFAVGGKFPHEWISLRKFV